jgi:hypothetical protein
MSTLKSLAKWILLAILSLLLAGCATGSMFQPSVMVHIRNIVRHCNHLECHITLLK